MSERIVELEHRVKTLETMMVVLQEWMKAVEDVQDADGRLFDNLNKRLKALEYK